MGKTFISDLKSGQMVRSQFAVIRREVSTFRDPTKGVYLSMTLGDKSGRIEARKWEVTEEELRSINAGDVILVKGQAEEFRGELQLNVQELTLVAEEDISSAYFLPAAKKPFEELGQEVMKTVEGVEETNIKKFLQSIFSNKEFLTLYCKAPAAKHIHHAYLGGLAEHSLEVNKVASMVAGFFENADPDILTAGSLLHDIGKIKEYSFKNAINLTAEGRLTGHIVIGNEMVKSQAEKTGYLSQEQVQHLSHLILSHHGEREQGAPVLPQTLEAAILHYADLISGKTNQYYTILKNDAQKGEEWTKYDRLLQRYLYKGFNAEDF